MLTSTTMFDPTNIKTVAKHLQHQEVSKSIIDNIQENLLVAAKNVVKLFCVGDP